VHAERRTEIADFEKGHAAVDDEVVGLEVCVDDAFLLEVGQADEKL